MSLPILPPTPTPQAPIIFLFLIKKCMSPSVALVQAGWQEMDLVIFSTAKGLRILERYQLVNPNRLRLDLEVQADGVNRKLTRFFDRKRRAGR